MFSIVAALALVVSVPLLNDEYELLPSATDSSLGLWRRDQGQEYTSIGRLDTAGNFVPFKDLSNRRGVAGMTDAPEFLTHNYTGEVYEYRSGVLIPGQIDEQSLNFVPEFGGRVIDFQDYLKGYRPGASRLVWNLPGVLHKKGTPTPVQERVARQIEQLKQLGIPVTPDVIEALNNAPSPRDTRPGGLRSTAGKAPPAPAAPVPPGIYEFVPDTARWVEVRRKERDQEYWSLGKLDAAGNFAADNAYLNQTGPATNLPPGVVRLNPRPTGPVYEFRSGRLVRGRIDDNLNFVPEADSKVVSFQEYSYGSRDSRLGPEPLPIWNLPGTFQKKDPDKK
jgi:hypothetical protein